MIQVLKPSTTESESASMSKYTSLCEHSAPQTLSNKKERH